MAAELQSPKDMTYVSRTIHGWVTPRPDAPCSSLPEQHRLHDNKVLRENGVWGVGLATRHIFGDINATAASCYAWQCLSADLASEMAWCSVCTVNEGRSTEYSTFLERVQKVQTV